MSNLDVAVSSFWQLARHWKSGGKSKPELYWVTLISPTSTTLLLITLLIRLLIPQPIMLFQRKKSLLPSCAVRNGGGRRLWLKLSKLPQT